MTPNEPSNSSRWPQTLIDVLERQHVLVDQLDGLAMQQAEFIEKNATDQLMSLLSRRQNVIDEFTGSQGELAKLTQDMDERLQEATEAQRDRIRSLIGEIGSRLAGVMQRDEVDQESLRSSRNAIKQEMSALGNARQARGAYVTPKGQQTRFADRRG